MAKHSFSAYRDLIGQTAGPTDATSSRVRIVREGTPRLDGCYVLYWMQMAMRTTENHALESAVRAANQLDLPLLVYQGLNPDYPGANDRVHTFILESARDVARDLAARGIPYRFHLRSKRSGEEAVAAQLALDAACAFVDDFPAFILPRVTEGFVRRTADSAMPITAVDSNGLVPLAEIPDRQYAAHTIRPRLHARIPDHLVALPESSLTRRHVPALPVPEDLFVDLASMDDAGLADLVAECEIDHSVLPSLVYAGGSGQARARLDRFLDSGLAGYAQASRDPGRAATSSLSPYLHFGCISSLEIVRAALAAEGDAESTDAFLEQVVVRRELAYNFCRYTPVDEHTTLDALPDWARATLEEHASDERQYLYSPEELEAAATHDEVWNAAQRELVSTGTFHGYLRMLWGKNVIRWTRSYREAQDFMVRMHHKYALDGRNPNTYASILWCYGLHDRAFQQTPVLGKLRPLKSSATRRKFDLDPYFERVAHEVERRGMAILESGRPSDTA